MASALSAEKFSSPLQIVIVLLNLITQRTNGQTLVPVRMQPELVDSLDFFVHAVQSGRLEKRFYGNPSQQHESANCNT